VTEIGEPVGHILPERSGQILRHLARTKFHDPQCQHPQPSEDLSRQALRLFGLLYQGFWIDGIGAVDRSSFLFEQRKQTIINIVQFFKRYRRPLVVTNTRSLIGDRTFEPIDGGVQICVASPYYRQLFPEIAT
jgi:hypothetical protein